jgi:hypothetical protein
MIPLAVIWICGRYFTQHSAIVGLQAGPVDSRLSFEKLMFPQTPAAMAVPPDWFGLSRPLGPFELIAECKKFLEHYSRFIGS